MRALIALGSNLAHDGLSGPALLREAVRRMEAAHIFVIAKSSIWRTAPWPPSHMRGQADYVNAIVSADVSEEPAALLETLLGIERMSGRTRRDKWEARTLDLDLIDLDGRAGAFGDVTLPHPRAHERAFVLAPLEEVAPDWRHPLLKQSAAELLAALPGEQGIEALEPL